MLIICNIFSSHDFAAIDTSRQKTLARKYAKLALQSATNLSLHDEIGFVLCISSAQGDTVDQIRSEHEQWSKLREEDTRLWLHAWQRLIDEIDVKFDFRQTYQMYPDPPLGMVPGVAPEAVKDPKLRAQYEAAIETNKQKAEKFVRQSELRDLDKYFSLLAENHLIAMYSTPPYNTGELKHYLDLYIVDKERKTKILKAVEEAIKRNTEVGKNKVPQTVLENAEAE
jgi:hypothetical protein